jgi:hypothetical protein
VPEQMRLRSCQILWRQEPETLLTSPLSALALRPRKIVDVDVASVGRDVVVSHDVTRVSLVDE